MIYLSRAVYIYIWLISTHRFNVYIPGTHLSFVLPPKQGFFQSKHGTFGFQVLCIASFASNPSHWVAWLGFPWKNPQEPGRRDAEKEGGRVAEQNSEGSCGLWSCNWGGGGGRVMPKDGGFTINFQWFRDGNNTWIWLKDAESKWPLQNQRLFAKVVHYKTPTWKVDTDQVGMVPNFCPCPGHLWFLYVIYLHIWKHIQRCLQTLVLFGSFKIKINHGKFIVSLKLLPNIRMFLFVCFCYILGIPLRRTPAYPPWFHRYAPCAKSGSFLEVPCSSKSISWVVREVGKWHLPQGCTKTWWKMVGKVVWSIVKLLHICKIHVRTFWVLVSFCSYWVCAIFVTAPTVPTRHTFAWGWKVNEGFPKVQQKGLFG